MQGGLDYLYSSIDMSSGDFNKDLETRELGAFLGYKFPILFRIYGGYIFLADGISRINSTGFELNNGKGLKVGLGFTLLPFIDINLEYRRMTYDEAELGPLKISTDTDYEALMLGLSLPLNLFD